MDMPPRYNLLEISVTGVRAASGVVRQAGVLCLGVRNFHHPFLMYAPSLSRRPDILTAPGTLQHYINLRKPASSPRAL